MASGWRDYDRVVAERDALRVEKAEWVKVFDDMVLVQQRTEAERDALRAENEPDIKMGRSDKMTWLKPRPGEVLFEIVDNVEYATLHADDFRTTMRVSDALHEARQAEALARLRVAWHNAKTAFGDSEEAYAFMAMDTLLGVNDRDEPFGAPTLFERADPA